MPAMASGLPRKRVGLGRHTLQGDNTDDHAGQAECHPA
jgi:hypothetical protein